MSSEGDEITYRVVVNQLGQYSVWPASRGVPSGWQAVGFEGSRQACLGRISELWTDIGPRRG